MPACWRKNDDFPGWETGLKRLDGRHDPLSDPFVILFAVRSFQFLGTEADRWADADGDASEADAAGATWQGIACAGYSNRLDDRAGFCGDQADAGSRRPDAAVERSGAFREDEDAMAFLEFADDGFQAGHVRALLVHRDRVPLRVEPFEEADEKRLASQEDHFRLVEISDQRWVEKALVIRGDEDRAIGD